jgi:hypothetical protein
MGFDKNAYMIEQLQFEKTSIVIIGENLRRRGHICDCMARKG